MNKYLIDSLLRTHKRLMEYTLTIDFDQKIFGRMMKEFTNQYNRASYIEQGEFHHIFCKTITERSNGR